MIAEPNTVYSEQLPRSVLLSERWRNSWKPLLIAVICSTVLLIAVYMLPLYIEQDIGSRGVPVTGLYAPEHNGHFSYAYTDGDAFIRLPNTGIGRFIVQLRMGGPNGIIPVTASLETPSQRISLGRLESIRVYHLVVPTQAEGDIQFHIRSTTTRLKTDPRELGVLFDWVHFQPLGLVAPPISLLLGTPLFLLLLWIIVKPLHTTDRFKIVLLLLCGALVCLGAAASRSKLALPLWQLIAADLFVVAVTSLTLFDGSQFATPFRSITVLFVGWRVALWLVSGVGLWYSAAVYHFAKGRTLAGSVVGHGQFVWNALAGSWMHFDSAHYQTIATKGYSFAGQQWPNIAFFPLYPLLIRLLLPITRGNAVLAALIVTHLALFATLLLLYDLVAHDFDQRIACRTLVFLLVFPSSVFFVAGYTEALALALAVAGVWAIRRSRWWVAGIAGFFLALTRLPGVLIAPILALAYLQHVHWRWHSVRPPFLATLLPPLGLGLFMLYQWWQFGTPVAFLIAQRAWGTQTRLPWITAYETFQALKGSAMWPSLVLQGVIWTSFIGLTLLALLRLPLPYGLTMLLFLIPPYVGSQYGSLVRHVLMGFPAFIVMAILAKRSWIRALLLSIMVALLVITTLIFVNGFWVA